MLTRSNISTCSDQALHQAIVEVCNSNRPKPNWYDTMIKDEIIFRARTRWFKSEKQSDSHLAKFITINFKPSATMDQIQKSIIKKTTSKLYRKYDFIYSYEQRSEIPDKYSGYHVHILFFQPSGGDHNGKAEQLKKHYRSFKKLLGSASSIDMKLDYTEQDIRRHILYILGNKRDEKMEKVRNDKNFRIKYNLKNYYSNNSEKIFSRYNINAPVQTQIQTKVKEI